MAKATLRRIMDDQLCTPIFIMFSKTCCQAKLIKKFTVFYIVDQFFTWLDCMS